MPLVHSKSPKAFKTNVKTLMGEVGESPHVQSRKQALAIAYSTQRRGKKKRHGGAVHIGKATGGSVKRRADRRQDGGAVDTFPGKQRFNQIIRDMPENQPHPQETFPSRGDFNRIMQDMPESDSMPKVRGGRARRCR